MKWILRILMSIVALVGFLIAAVYVIGSRLPEKHTAVRVARYNQPPDAIWQTITDYEKFPSWRSNVKSIAPLKSTDTAAAWRELDAHGNSLPYHLVGSDPPRRLAVEIADPNLPFGGTWTTDIQPTAANGGIVQITENGEIRNVFFRFMSRYIFGYTATMDTYLKDLGKKFGETVTIESGTTP
jgi:polyketide cyclase/dehydrase/lipid transport protein